MCVCGCARIVTCWGHLWRWKQPLRNETKDTDILEKEDKEADKEEKGEVGKWRGSVMSASQDLESFSQCVFEGNGRSKLKWPSRQLMKCVVWPVEGKPNYDTSPGPWPLHEWWKTGGRKSRWQSLLPPDAARRMCAEILTHAEPLLVAEIVKEPTDFPGYPHNGGTPLCSAGS